MLEYTGWVWLSFWKSASVKQLFMMRWVFSLIQLFGLTCCQDSALLCVPTLYERVFRWTLPQRLGCIRQLSLYFENRRWLLLEWSRVSTMWPTASTDNQLTPGSRGGTTLYIYQHKWRLQASMGMLKFYQGKNKPKHLHTHTHKTDQRKNSLTWTP